MLQKTILWAMMIAMMVGWGYMQARGGALSNSEYYICSASLMAGQLAAAVECAWNKAWGTASVQLYFFVSTGVGILIRFNAGAS